MEKVVFMSWKTKLLYNGIALFILGLFPCNINFFYILPYPSALFILKLFCEMNVSCLI